MAARDSCFGRLFDMAEYDDYDRGVNTERQGAGGDKAWTWKWRSGSLLLQFWITTWGWVNALSVVLPEQCKESQQPTAVNSPRLVLSVKALFTSRSNFRILKAIHASIFDSTNLGLGRIGLTTQVGQPHWPRPSHCCKVSKNNGQGNLLPTTDGLLACFQSF